MPLEAATSVTQRLDVGDVWTLAVLVTSDDTGTATAATTTATAVDPSGNSSVPTVTNPTTGLYRATVDVDEAGRWIASMVVAGYGTVVFQADASAPVPAAGMPTVADVELYLGSASVDFDSDELAGALAAERAAQAARCRVPAAYPTDLAEALLRRVARNLAMRALPLAVTQGDSDGGSTLLPGQDPEVRRLEAPWRRNPIG